MMKVHDFGFPGWGQIRVSKSPGCRVSSNGPTGSPRRDVSDTSWAQSKGNCNSSSRKSPPRQFLILRPKQRNAGRRKKPQKRSAPSDSIKKRAVARGARYALRSSPSRTRPQCETSFQGPRNCEAPFPYTPSSRKIDPGAFWRGLPRRRRGIREGFHDWK